MNYNTQREVLPMPEYGRAVQDMIDHALTIEDREQRQRCAQTIIGIMRGMFPGLRDVPDFQAKLWDHLAYMSDYRLDIDYPFEITRIDKEQQRPESISYPSADIRYRHYGHIVQDMLKVATGMSDGPERRQLVRLLAVQMKKDLLTWNRELATDERVAKDIDYYSNGQLSLQEGDLDVTFAQAPQQAQQNRQGHSSNRNRKNRHRF